MLPVDSYMKMLDGRAPSFSPTGDDLREMRDEEFDAAEHYVCGFGCYKREAAIPDDE